MSYDAAIQAVFDDSYIEKPLPELRELLKGCMDIHGSNPIALHRITHAAEAIRAEIASRFSSGAATWVALKCAVDDLSKIAPEDHDVMIQVGNISVVNARFIEPHSFLLEGLNQSGHRTWLVIHFTQLHASIVYLPKRVAEAPRIITGFSNANVV